MRHAVKPKVIDAFLRELAYVCKKHQVSPADMLRGLHAKAYPIPLAKKELVVRMRSKVWFKGNAGFRAFKFLETQGRLDPPWKPVSTMVLADLLGMHHASVVGWMKHPLPRLRA